ncbi:DUF624 domain-containing protein [Sanguibacter sp. HDW7]|uniref:DUF624 domain-containing protein n=1 Tax=Sanguibacter sp. HDW7 TaxID=2714931 RepID=UPI00140CA8F2|nr:DUF624 domain-containing protein [Sanguibacter sp. HDW7]QIK84686.1 DUF624 domain-containing protein [Sanguibacter sp. HDW7]
MAQSVAPARAHRTIFTQEGFELVADTVWAALATNLLLTVGSLPFVVLLLTTDPRSSWPALVVAAVLAAPALTASFGVFGTIGTGPRHGPVRTFLSAYRRTLGRSLALGALVAGTVTVLVVDIVVLLGTTVGAVTIPLLAVLTLVAVATGLVAAVALPDHTDVRLRTILKVSLWTAVRRLFLTAPSLVVVMMLAAAFTLHPALALGALAAPLLYAAWGGARYALHSSLTAAATRR